MIEFWSVATRPIANNGEVYGKQVHDARLVAVMLNYNIKHLLTFNTDHFKRFTTITAVNPTDLA